MTAENDPPCEHDECYWSDGSESVPGDEGICCDCGASRPIPPAEDEDDECCDQPGDRFCARDIPPEEHLIGTCPDGSRCQAPRECVAARSCTRHIPPGQEDAG